MTESPKRSFIPASVQREETFASRDARFNPERDLTATDQSQVRERLDELRQSDNLTPFFRLATHYTLLFPDDHIDLDVAELQALAEPEEYVTDSISKALAAKILLSNAYPLFDLDLRNASDRLGRGLAWLEFDDEFRRQERSIIEICLLDRASLTLNALVTLTKTTSKNRWHEKRYGSMFYGLNPTDTEDAAWTRILSPYAFEAVPQDRATWEKTKTHLDLIRRGEAKYLPYGWEKYSQEEQLAHHAVNMLFMGARDVSITKERIQITR